MAYRLSGRSFAATSVYPAVREGLIVRDDFTGAALSVFSNSGGTATSGNWPGSVGAPGIARMSVSAVADIGRVLSDSVFGAGFSLPFKTGGGGLYFEGRVRLISLPDGVNQFAARGGLGDTQSADQANGIYFENDRNVHGDNNWRVCTASGSVRTKTNTGAGFAPVANTWQRMRAEINAGGTSVSFFINGSLVATHAANIPASDIGYFLHNIKTLGSVARAVEWDYVEVGQTFSVSR